MRLLPRSLFARLMLIWLVGMALVLAVSLALFLGETRAHRAQCAVRGRGTGDRQRRRVCSTACVAARARERWIDEIAAAACASQPRPPTIICVRSPTTTRCRPRARGHAATPATLVHPSARRPPPPSLAIVLALPPTAPRCRSACRASRRCRRSCRISAALSCRPRRAGAGVGLLTWIAVRIATPTAVAYGGRRRALGEGPDARTHGHARPHRGRPRPPPPSTRCSSVSPSTSPSVPASWQRSPTTCRRRSPRLRLRAEMVDDEGLRARIQSDPDACRDW